MPTVLARYGPDAVIAEGYRVCVYDRLVYGPQQMELTDETDRIIMEVPMSEDDAIELTVLAPIDLACGHRH
jgi:hypothetical protein